LDTLKLLIVPFESVCDDLDDLTHVSQGRKSNESGRNRLYSTYAQLGA